MNKRNLTECDLDFKYVLDYYCINFIITNNLDDIKFIIKDNYIATPNEIMEENSLRSNTERRSLMSYIQNHISSKYS